MRVLIATDAWHPQVNGVVRTLTSLAQSARELGVDIAFLSPEGFWSVPAPTYPSLRLALPTGRGIAGAIEASEPDAIHIATEGPIGLMARAYCVQSRAHFTTSYTTRFPEYISARWLVPETGPTPACAVSTPRRRSRWCRRHRSRRNWRGAAFGNLGMWTRGVDTDLFAPDRAIDLDLPRPVFLTAGRIAIEKNLAAFLSLDLPGSKVVVGEGPQEAELRRRFPDVHFMGLKEGAELASYVAAADVFVFPSRTDTFGVVQLEALACGVPVAAFPVMGPKDVIGDHPVGALDDDLRRCLPARSHAFAHGMQDVRTELFLGEQRAPVHRAPEAG